MVNYIHYPTGGVIKSMVFIEYNPTRGGLRPGSAKLTKTHLILSPDMQEKIGEANVAVAYDSDEKILRLTPVESGGLKLTDGKLQSKGFTKYFGIDTKGLFDARWDDNEEAIFIVVDNKTT